jgi:hypothetical protein
MKYFIIVSAKHYRLRRVIAVLQQVAHFLKKWRIFPHIKRNEHKPLKLE